MKIASRLIADVGLGTFQAPSDAYSANSASSGQQAVNNLEDFISKGIGALTLLAGLFFVFYFVMGGLNWITAGGEQGKIQKARDQMVQGVIGLVVIVMAYGLIGVVGKFVGLDLLNPGQELIRVINGGSGTTNSGFRPSTNPKLQNNTQLFIPQQPPQQAPAQPAAPNPNSGGGGASFQ